jgi:NADH-quinone oxidoreductase subunit M
MEILLVTSVFLPTLASIVIWTGAGPPRHTALVVSLLTLAIGLVLAGAYPVDGPQGAIVPGQFAVVDDLAWMGQSSPWLDIRLSMGLDGLSLWLYLLAALLTVVSVAVSWTDIQMGPRAFYGHLMLLETGMLGVFVARDLILFYIFFELTLIPLFFLIGIWGSEARRYAAIKFFLFTLAGSVLTFLALLGISLWHYFQFGRLTFSIPQLTTALASRPMDFGTQLLLFVGLFAGFAIKVPLVPFHTWLPLAHVEAPTAGSILLAGILLKVGSYGFVRFCLPMLPDATAYCLPSLAVLCVAGIVYGSLVALAQQDLKRLIAFSSIGHLGFCMLGVFSLTPTGVAGGVLQMINHGISTGALFALVGMLYERFHTRQMAAFGGLARMLPVWAFFMGLMVFASIGLPGLNGFAGEVMVLLGFFQRAWGEAQCPPQWFGLLGVLSVLAVSGVVLGAWYMLWMMERVIFGPLRLPGDGKRASLRNDSSSAAISSHCPHGPSASWEQGRLEQKDLGSREIWALVPLAILVVWIGVYPQFFLRRMEHTISYLSAPSQRAINRIIAQSTEMPGNQFADARGVDFGTQHIGSQVALQARIPAKLAKGFPEVGFGTGLFRKPTPAELFRQNESEVSRQSHLGIFMFGSN